MPKKTSVIYKKPTVIHGKSPVSGGSMDSILQSFKRTGNKMLDISKILLIPPPVHLYRYLKNRK